MTSYELWDIESANMVGAYATEAEAFIELRSIIASYGRAWVRGWELVRINDDEPAESVIAGEMLIARATDKPIPHTA